MQTMKFSERAIITIFLLIAITLIALDIYTDLISGASFKHMLVEFFLGIWAAIGIVILWAKNFILKIQVSQLDHDVTEWKMRAAEWKTQNAHILNGLSSAIDEQLERWKLSISEKEIALFLLKGLSLKEIAEIRKTSERTVRQQSLAIYSKAGLAGRAELSAYFLEDLLSPQTNSNQAAK